MRRFPLSLLLFVGYFSLAGTLFAQINVSTPGHEVRIGTDGSVAARSGKATGSSNSGNDARVTVGGIAEGANVEGVTIINDRVSIDGTELPPTVTRYTSPKTGKVYLIERKAGSVSVSEAGGRK